MRQSKNVVVLFFEQLWCLFLSIIVPQYIKKVIFISSVYAVLFELSPNDKDAFRKINDKFRLVSDPEILSVLQELTRSPWHKALVTRLLHEAMLVKAHEMEAELPKSHLAVEAISDEYKPALHLAGQLVKSMPSWLRYTKPEDQAADIVIPAHEKLTAYA